MRRPLHRQGRGGGSLDNSHRPPHWICRVGDFTNREDASAYMHKIKSRGISEAMVVKSEIYVTADQLKNL